MVAYVINKSVELLPRFEIFDPYTDFNDNEETLITLGDSYFIFPGNWTSGKITVVYVLRDNKLNTNGNDLAIIYFM